MSLDLPVRVSMNPFIARLQSGTYAISGATWIPVPDGTTRADLPKYMTWEPFTEAPQAPSGRVWTVQGSKGQTYTVEAVSGFLTCSCKGYQFRRKCRHIEEVKQSVE
jgi:hypothetical protein